MIPEARPQRFPPPEDAPIVTRLRQYRGNPPHFAMRDPPPTIGKITTYLTYAPSVVKYVYHGTTIGEGVRRRLLFKNFWEIPIMLLTKTGKGEYLRSYLRSWYTLVPNLSQPYAGVPRMDRVASCSICACFFARRNITLDDLTLSGGGDRSPERLFPPPAIGGRVNVLAGRRPVKC